MFDLGIFEDVRLGLELVLENFDMVVVIVNIVEKSMGFIVFGGGVSFVSGLFGIVSY